MLLITSKPVVVISDLDSKIGEPLNVESDLDSEVKEYPIPNPKGDDELEIDDDDLDDVKMSSPEPSKPKEDDMEVSPEPQCDPEPKSPQKEVVKPQPMKEVEPVKKVESKPKPVETKPEPEPMEVEKDDQSDLFCPIKALNTMSNDWQIRVRVTKKTPLKTLNMRNGNTGHIMKCELMDYLGQQIEAQFWGEAAEKFDPIVQQGNVYIMSKGTVKMANRKFSSINNDYCLNFNQYSEIKEVKDSGDIKNTGFDFITLDQVKEMMQVQTIDLLGVITSTGDVDIQKFKNGDSKPKRVIELVDNTGESGYSVSLTIWGD